MSEAEVRATVFFLFNLTVSLRYSRAALGVMLGRVELLEEDSALLLRRLEAIARSVLAEEDR